MTAQACIYARMGCAPGRHLPGEVVRGVRAHLPELVPRLDAQGLRDAALVHLAAGVRRATPPSLRAGAPCRRVSSDGIFCVQESDGAASRRRARNLEAKNHEFSSKKMVLSCIDMSMGFDFWVLFGGSARGRAPWCRFPMPLRRVFAQTF